MSQATTALTESPADANAQSGTQYLSFVCAGEEYGVGILRVQEIKGWDGVTRVPYAPHYVLGVMNLRGVIVPVINLRARFGLEARPFNASTVVIVVRAASGRGEKTVGIVVDGVSEVYSVASSMIKPVPELGGVIDTAWVSGIATVDGKMIMLLDIDALVAACIETRAAGQLNA
ncbi:MAG TPA: chemotaxis protein CheW [Steroidobacteraceae bacterium]|nr:chemotaxis protein CheW [Steroidobacteraceae bacterium]